MGPYSCASGGVASAKILEITAHKYGTSTFPTRLTQNQRRVAQGGPPQSATMRSPLRDKLCRGCGKTIDPDYTHCENCRIEEATKRMPDVAQVGRLTAHGPQAQAKRRDSRLRHVKASRACNPFAPARLAHGRVLFGENSAKPYPNLGDCDCKSDWSDMRLWQPHSPRQPTAPEALAGSCATPRYRRIRLNSSV